MNPTLILYPVFVQVALTFGLLLWMGRSRVASVKRGAVKIKDIALGQSAWPPAVTQIDRSFHNQFEFPILFYALVALLLITHEVDVFQLALAWVYVIVRLAHAYVHTTSNKVQVRFNIFLASIIVLIAMWVLFAAKIASSSLTI